jgi:hypothetical protein
MALRAIKPKAVEKRLKALFYGSAGVGKTTASIQFPRPYLIDTEKGAENDQYVKMLEKTGGVIFQTTDFDELITEVKSLLTENHEYKTLIIDPLTILYNDLIDKSAAALKAASKEKDATGTEFGRHYGEANKKMKHLCNLLLRLDMNVIITSHAKTQYSDNMKSLGDTYDCYKKLDYIFDLVFEIQKRATDRVGIVKKTRIESFTDNEQFPFSYDSIADKYGRSVLERDAKPEVLATPEQVIELKRLIELLKVSEDDVQKWKDKAGAETFDEMQSEKIDKCINFLNSKIIGANLNVI